MAEVDFDLIRVKVESGDYQISVHATKRLRSRQLAIADLENVILKGEIIERDPMRNLTQSVYSWVRM